MGHWFETRAAGQAPARAGDGPDPRSAAGIFISCAVEDEAIARSIEEILRAAGETVALLDRGWNATPTAGDRDRGQTADVKVIGLLSPAYLASPYCRATWTQLLAADPLNERRRFVPIRVQLCNPTGLLAPLGYLDLVGRLSSARLQELVLAAVSDEPGVALTTREPLWRKPARQIAPRLSRPIPDFTGRSEALYDIDAAIGARQVATLVPADTVPSGSGVGLSALAHQYAHLAAKADGYWGVWWLNAARDPGSTQAAPRFETFHRSLVELGAQFNPALRATGNVAEAARLTLDQLLAGDLGAPWLLVYDSVDSPQLLRDWVGRGPFVRSLVTTSAAEPGGAATIADGRLTPGDSLSYLRAASGRPDVADASLVRLAAQLEHLPLALAHAAAFLRSSRDANVAGYIGALVQDMPFAPQDAACEPAVFATVRQAFAAAESVASGAQAVLALAAFLAPETIPESLFGSPAHYFPPELAEVVVEPARLQSALEALADFGLIGRDASLHAFAIHRQVQAVVQDALGARSGEVAAAAAAVVAQARAKGVTGMISAADPLLTHALAVTARPEESMRYLRETAERETARDVLAEAARIGRTPRQATPSRDQGPASQHSAAAAGVKRSPQPAPAKPLVTPDPAGDGRTDFLVKSRSGEASAAAGDWAGAITAYRAALAIAKQGLDDVSHDQIWQRDLGLTHGRLGMALLKGGERAAARHHLGRQRMVTEQLALGHSGDPRMLLDVAISHVHLLNVAEGREETRTHLMRSASILRFLKSGGQLPADREALLERVEAVLREED